MNGKLIAGISGSPRAGGNTDMLLRARLPAGFPSRDIEFGANERAIQVRK